MTFTQIAPGHVRHVRLLRREAARACGIALTSFTPSGDLEVRFVVLRRASLPWLTVLAEEVARNVRSTCGRHGCMLHWQVVCPECVAAEAA
jgi:hypothetical protein